MYYTYILKSQSSGKYYIGSINNINRRLQEHNKGISQYTRNRGPWLLQYKEIFSSRSEAVRRERYLKSLKKRLELEKIMSSAPIV